MFAVRMTWCALIESRDIDPMKKMCIGLLMLVGSAAVAAPWEKVLTCDNGAAVIDVDTAERRNLQLVIRDTAVLKHLHERHAFRLEFGTRELALGGRQEHGVFHPRDFQYLNGKFGYIYDERLIFVTREATGVKLKIGKRIAVYENCTGSCRENPLSMQCESACSVPTRHYEQELASWTFQRCD